MSEIVILGGGVIGLCTAYSLLTSPLLPPESQVTLVDNCSIGAGASTRAGGFISRDWHDPPSASLGRLSWELHSRMAQEAGEETYGWRTTGAVGIRVGDERAERSAYRALPTEGETRRFRYLNGAQEDLGHEGIAQLFVSSLPSNGVAGTDRCLGIRRNSANGYIVERLN